MNNKKLRVVSLVLVCAMLLVASLTGCNKKTGAAGGDNLNPLGADTISKEKVSIEFMMSNSGQVENYDTNKYTLELERKGNVDIKFNLLSPADAGTKINLVLSSGKDLPDVINSNLSDDLVATYGSAGMFVTLNDYYENSSYYLKPQLDAYEKETGVNLLDYITMSDGNIYGIIKYNESLQNEIPSLLWIYKPWLEKAGLKVPTTLDELVTALTYFKTHDMNGNGKSDEIPMVDYTDGTLFWDLMNAFIKTGIEQMTIKEDGTISMAYMEDGYKDFLKYANKLYSAGLLDPVTFSQDNDTRKTLLNGETTIVGVYSATSSSVLTAGSARRENQEYAPMFLDNPNKAGYTTFRYAKTMPSQAMFITKDNPYPETSFRLADYMCSEEMTVWSRWGEKGTDWLEPTESTVGMYEFMGYPAYLEPVLQWGSKQNSHWQNGAPGFRRTNVSLGMASNDASQLSKAIAIEELYNRYGADFVSDVSDERIYKLIYTTDELAERADITTTVDSYVKNMRYEFITGKTSIDSGWNAYIKELKGMNVDRLIEINNAAYTRING